MRLWHIFCILSTLFFTTAYAEDALPAPTPPVTHEITPEAQPIHNFQESGSNAAFIRTLLGLMAVIVIIAATLWFFKRSPLARNHTLNQKKNIKILEQRQLSPKTMLYLVEIAGKQVLISESHVHVEKITTIDWPAESKEIAQV